jgi:2'-5' RNA ligase
VDLGETRLDTLVLFRSDLQPGGAVYAALARFPLGRPAVD